MKFTKIYFQSKITIILFFGIATLFMSGCLLLLIGMEVKISNLGLYSLAYMLKNNDTHNNLLSYYFSQILHPKNYRDNYYIQASIAMFGFVLIIVNSILTIIFTYFLHKKYHKNETEYLKNITEEYNKKNKNHE